MLWPNNSPEPIPIDTDRLQQVPELRAWSYITQSAPSPELREGANTVSVHYMRDKTPVASGEIMIVAK
jgi:hypothetical protein